MAKAETGDWGIHFMVEVRGSGYEWQSNPEGVSVLAPPNWYGQEPHDPEADVARTVRFGRDVARRATRGMRQLSERVNADDTVAMTVIKAFADDYGLLRGRDQPMTLSEWRKELATFAGVYEVSAWLREGKVANVDRFLELDDRFEQARFRSPDLFVPFLQGFPTEAKPNPYQAFCQLGARAKTWTVFARVVRDKLEGGLSLLPGNPAGEDAGVVNKDLRSLLYVRLWLDTKDSRELEMVCKECGHSMEGNQGRKYCSSACRQKAYRRLKRAAVG